MAFSPRSVWVWVLECAEGAMDGVRAALGVGVRARRGCACSSALRAPWMASAPRSVWVWVLECAEGAMDGVLPALGVGVGGRVR
jgi:hypothetical protein